jgi:hypothetical protein
MESTEYLAGGVVMMALAGYAFYRMILLWERGRLGGAFVLGATWAAAVAGAMWFAWPRDPSPAGAADPGQRTAMAWPNG